MRHFQNTIPISITDTKPLLEQVFRILDSKIQFIDFQVQRYFNSCTASMKPLATPSDESQQDHAPKPSLVNNLEQILSFTEKLQNDLKRLQTLKAWLKEETAPEVLCLLTNNHYLSFKEDQLEQVLRQKVLLQDQITVA